MDKNSESEQFFFGAIPRGIEVLIKKASVDPEFRQILLQKRAGAAEKINLELTEVERTMLSNIPTEHLDKIVENTKVKPEHRKVFLGTAAALMLAAVAGLTVVPMTRVRKFTAGISPDRVRKLQMKNSIGPNDPNDVNDSEKLEDVLNESEQSQENRTK